MPSATRSPIALLEEHGFTAHDFKVFHPGGQLGASLLFVGDIMHGPEDLPLGSQDMPMDAAIVTMTQKSFGCLGVTDADGRLVGILTDGDLRRHMTADLLSRSVGEVMTRQPGDRAGRHAGLRGDGNPQFAQDHSPVRARRGRKAGGHRAHSRPVARGLA